MDHASLLLRLERIIGAGFGRLPRLAAGGMGLAIPPDAELVLAQQNSGSIPDTATLAIVLLIGGGGGGSGGCGSDVYNNWYPTADSSGGGAGELAWGIIDLEPYKDADGLVQFLLTQGDGGVGGDAIYGYTDQSLGSPGGDSTANLWKSGPYPWSPHSADLVITAKGGGGGYAAAGTPSRKGHGTGGRAIVLPRPGVWESHQPGDSGSGASYGSQGTLANNQGFGGRGWPGSIGFGGHGAPQNSYGGAPGYQGGGGLVSLWWC